MKLISLSKGKFAMVDDADYAWAMQWKWQAGERRYANLTKFYAERKEYIPGSKAKKVYLHRAIINVPDGIEVDHRDNDTLNCQRANLRQATSSQNKCNRRLRVGKFKGVTFNSLAGSWTGSVYFKGQRFYIGYHATADEAARAYDALARELHGEFARLNFPKEGEQSCQLSN